MSRRCELGLNADDILTALDEGISSPTKLDPVEANDHLAGCPSCREVVLLRKKARTAWTTAMASHASTFDALERRGDLRRAWEQRSRRPSEPRRLAQLTLAPALAVGAILVVFALRSSLSPAGSAESLGNRPEALPEIEPTPSSTASPASSLPPLLAARSDKKTPVASGDPPPRSKSALKDTLSAPSSVDSRDSARDLPSPKPAEREEDRLAAARALAHAGDERAARAELMILVRSTDPKVARRASFTLAELDLAKGDREAARALLSELVTNPEPSLGADAATLFAHTLSSADERAAVWQRYLSTSPPPVYFSRGQLERADALLDARRTSEAEAILADLRGRSQSLNNAQHQQLDRLTVKARK